MNANPNVAAVPRHPTTGQIMWRMGQPYEFITTRPFTLGQTGLQVHAHTEIWFDGTKATLEGADYNLPFLRGAVKQGWLVLAEEYDPEDPSYGAPTSANIQVRHATKGGNPMDPQPRTAIITTASDEREVGSVSRHASQTRTANQGYVRGQTTVNTVQAGTAVKTQRGMMVVEEQDGVIVPGRTLKTPSGERAKHTRADMDKAGELLRQANNVQVEPGVGTTQEEMLSRMTPEQQETYLAQKEAHRAQYVNEPPPSPAAVVSRRTVARVQSKTARTTESFGTTATLSVGGGTEISDGDGEVVGTVKNETESFEQEGMTFKTTNGPRRAQAAAPAQVQARPTPKAAGPAPEVRLRLAKQICADFPSNYDFALSSKKKLARITADFEDRADVIRAIFAAEDDEMKGFLFTEFPQVFEEASA